MSLANLARVRSLRTAIAAAALGAVALPVGTATAQVDDEAEALEEVVVTGSRLKQSNLVSTTAVNVFDTETIDLSGATNMSDLIRTLPATGVSALTTTNSNFTVNSSGINTVELRNLGEDRTLVLVNGRRFVAGVPGSQIVDFNAIPPAFIERIDVVTGGASAIYGSDALAGVVNIITKTDFEGLEISAQSGVSDAEDNETILFSVTGGLPFANDRGNAMFSYTYEENDGVFARDRDGLETDAISEAFFTGDSFDYNSSVVPFFSSFSELGRFIIPQSSGGNLGNFVFDGSQTIPFVSAEHGFNRQAFRALNVPLERNLLAANINYGINSSTNLFVEATYASVESQSSLEPFPLSSDDVYGDNAQRCDPTSLTCSFGIPGTNPFIPADMLQLARDANPGIADEDLAIGFARRMTELDQRGADNLRQTFRFVTGVEGTFLNDRLDYNVSYNWGRTTQSQRSTGQINVVNMRNSLDAIVDPTTNEIICRDPIARAEGCIPVNLFGIGSITAGLDDVTRRNLLTYLKAPASTQAAVEQHIVNAYVSGPVVELPAGDMRFVLGAEYRDESSESVGDALSQQGLNAGNAIPPTIGGFNVSEIFGELEIPLLADVPFASQLDLSLAARFSDYSTVGSTEAYSGAIKYRPIDELLVRAQYARAVRAPNISELFQPLSQTFPNVTDPCSGVTVDGSGTPAFLNDSTDAGSGVDPSTVGSQTAVTCLQDPTVDARVAAEGAVVLTQPEIQGVSGFNGGAAAGGATLDPETADTITAGFVWSPTFASWAEGFNISVDYFQIEIEDGISALGRQLALDRCYGAESYNPNSDFCAGIIRFADGPSVGALRFSNAFSQNLASIETSGIDLQASYAFDLPGTIGSLDLSLTYTNLLDYDVTPFPGSPTTSDAGEIGFSEHEALFGILYSWNDLRLFYNAQFIGEAVIDNEGFWAGPTIDAATFHDIQARYTIGDALTLVGGIDNFTDEYVNVGFSTPPTSVGWNTAPDVYDGLGRRYYLGLRLDF